MKLGQLIEKNKRNIFFKNYAQNQAAGLVPDVFFIQNSLIRGERKCSTA